MKILFLYMGLWVAILSISCTAEASTTQLAPTLHLNTTDVGLKKVKLVVGSANVTVMGTSGHKIRVTARPSSQWKRTFIFTWHYRKRRHELASLRRDHIQTSRTGSTLIIRMGNHASNASSHPQPNQGPNPQASATSASHNVVTIEPFRITIGAGSGTATKWIVLLPKDLAFSIEGGTGTVSISGLRGGIHIEFGVGDVSANLPTGPVHAALGTGKLQVTISKKEYHKVHLAAGIGGVALYVSGRKIMKGVVRHITSTVQNVTGRGNSDYSLSVGVGRISLALAPNTRRLQ